MRIPLRMSLLLGVLIAASSLFAQSPPSAQSGTQAATNNPEVSSSTGNAQSVGSATSIDRRDALVSDLWKIVREYRYADGEARARELLQLESSNSLALVTLAASRSRSASGDSEALGYAKRALRAVDELKQPGNMSEGDYQQMVRSVRAVANHVAGTVYMKRNDVVSARKYLKESVALSPNNGEFAYSAALAYLDGKNADASTGYWLLARAVNLAGTSSDAAQIAAYARERYQKDGGSSENWDRFLASATVAAPPIDRSSVQLASGSAPGPATTATASPKAKSPEDEKSVMMASARSAPDVRDKQPPKLPPLSPPPRTELEPVQPRKPLPMFRTGAPISLGIVIQASVASKGNRASVVYTLSDMVRGLRETDEAFIASYGRKVTFGQDLTWNYELLEQAMDEIGSENGAALLDAVGFAADHLRRIAKNENRILLVVSDGSEGGSHSFSSEVTTLIRNSGTRILCIGIGVADTGSRDRMHELAKMTGGQVTFIDGPGEFRSAAHQLASALGVHFQE